MAKRQIGKQLSFVYFTTILLLLMCANAATDSVTPEQLELQLSEAIKKEQAHRQDSVQKLFSAARSDFSNACASANKTFGFLANLSCDDCFDTNINFNALLNNAEKQFAEIKVTAIDKDKKNIQVKTLDKTVTYPFNFDAQQQAMETLAGEMWKNASKEILDQLAITPLKCKGTATQKLNLKFDAQFTQTEPLGTVFATKAAKIYVKDLVAVAQLMNPNVSIKPIATFDYLTDVSLGIRYDEENKKPQFLFQGNLEFLGEKILVAGIISDSGIAAKGTYKQRVKIGDYVTIRGLDEGKKSSTNEQSKPDTEKVNVPEGPDLIWMDAKDKQTGIWNNQLIINGSVDVDTLGLNPGAAFLDENGWKIITVTQVAVLPAHVTITGKFGAENAMNVDFSIINLANIITEKVIIDNLTSLVKQVSKKIEDVVNSTKDKCTKLPNGLEEACGTLLSGINEALDKSQEAFNKIIDVVKKMAPRIEKVTFSSAISDIKAAHDATVSYSIAGKSGSLTAEINLKETHSLVDTLTKAIAGKGRIEIEPLLANLLKNLNFIKKISVAGISLNENFVVPLDDITQSQISITIDQGLLERVRTAVSDTADKSKKTITDAIQTAKNQLISSCQTINTYLNPLLSVSCDTCINSVDLTSPVMENLQEVLTAAISSIDITSAGFTASLQELLQGKLPGLHVNASIFGNTQVLTIGNFDLKNPQTIVPQISQALWQSFLNSDDGAASLVAKNTAELTSKIASSLLQKTFTCSATMLGTIPFSVQINPSNPQATVATAQINKICMDDLIKLVQLFDKNISAVTLPGIGCLTNATITVRGSAAIGLPTMTIEGDLQVFTTTAHVYGSLSAQGLILNGSLQNALPISPTITLSSAGASGPAIAAEISKNTQQISLKGLVNLANVINNAGMVTLKSTGWTINTTMALAGTVAQVQATAQVGQEAGAIATITLGNELTGQVKAAVIGSIKQTANTTFTTAQNTFNAVKSKCNELPSGLSNLCSGVLSSANTTISAAQAAFNALELTLNSMSISIDKVVLKSSITTLNNALKGTVFYTLGTKGSFDIKATPQTLVTGITQAFTPLVTSAVQKQLTDLNNTSSTLQNTLSQTANLVAQALKDMMKNLDKIVAQLGQDGINAISDVTNSLASITTDISSIALEKGLGSVIGADEGKQAAEAVNTAINAANQAAQQAAKIASEAVALAGQALDKAKEIADQALKSAQKFAQEAVKALEDTFDPSDW